MNPFICHICATEEEMISDILAIIRVIYKTDVD